jgi:choline dehydrogenase-like flavoprotein
MNEPEAFDVIVVGGGAAGCVVAAKVAADTSRSVLLIEAGPDRRRHPPVEFRDGWKLARGFDWGYASEPDDRGVVENLRCGRLLGGTSTLTRFALRGSSADYDRWVALGNEGWSFDDVLLFFTRLETDLDFGEKPWHGRGGPIPINRYLNLSPTEVGTAAHEAMESLGFPPVSDHNQPGAVGVGRMPMSSNDGIRVTTAEAYLPISETPSNLVIRPDTVVDKVSFEGNRATGVTLSDGSEIKASWVTLCAGTYGSPPILLRSGVGPAVSLASLGISARVNLPGVGSNLADHPALDIACGTVAVGRDSPSLHSVATFHSADLHSDDSPDLMLWVADPPEMADESPEFEIGVVLLKPECRGSVRLRSDNPADPPRITLPSLHESDAARLAEGLMRGVDVASHHAVRRLCAGSPAELPDPAESQEWIRENSYSVPHVIGTCAMGVSPDDGAVVDSWGCVHGLERISVIDASIIPEAPSGFPHLITIMIAERLSENVREAL